MILFIPDYDAQTHANALVAEMLFCEGATRLAGPDATPEGLAEALGTGGLPLFAMSHGDSDRLVGHQGAPAVNPATFSDVAARITFAFACNTAQVLARKASDRNWTWWGYTCPICPPGSLIEEIPIFAELFQYVLDNFASCGTEAEMSTTIARLREKCDEAADRLSEMASKNVDVPISSYTCIRQLWKCLNVFRTQQDAPLRHSEGDFAPLPGI